MSDRARLLTLGAALSALVAPACTTFGFGRPVEVQYETHETPSGVRMLDLEHGLGPPAIHGSTVRVHYVASLADGTVFDASHDRGVPQEFTIGAGEVIPGWGQGMLGMRQGGRRRITIPPELAYGAEGLAGLIPPDSTIVIEVELLHVKAP